MLAEYLGKPLTEVPDPFGTTSELRRRTTMRGCAPSSIASASNTSSCATDCYRSGRFDATLLKMLARYDAVMAIMLPTLGRGAARRPTRRSCRSHPRPASCMQVPIDERDAAAGTIVWRDPETGERFETPVTGGHVKLQWKADWAMRWVALGVDYEMSGKDLIELGQAVGARSARRSAARRRRASTTSSSSTSTGQKISKSKGNGLTIDEWLAYATPESLSLFMFQKPRAAKRLYFDVIPRAVDDYLQLPREVSAARTRRAGSAIRSGTSMPAHRRAEHRRGDAAVPFVDAAQPRAVANTEEPACSGASSAATRRA